ncbi:hypothetical protein [Candidatus Thioglobus sp.]|uniref:hypothetical protein n=1 Tax=Candidatus Thioglobus sp. TaxID=2026721 RepID=UPI003D103240
MKLIALLFFALVSTSQANYIDNLIDNSAPSDAVYVAPIVDNKGPAEGVRSYRLSYRALKDDSGLYDNKVDFNFSQETLNYGDFYFQSELSQTTDDEYSVHQRGLPINNDWSSDHSLGTLDLIKPSFLRNIREFDLNNQKIKGVKNTFYNAQAKLKFELDAGRLYQDDNTLVVRASALKNINQQDYLLQTIASENTTNLLLSGKQTLKDASTFNWASIIDDDLNAKASLNVTAKDSSYGGFFEQKGFTYIDDENTSEKRGVFYRTTLKDKKSTYRLYTKIEQDYLKRSLAKGGKIDLYQLDLNHTQPIFRKDFLNTNIRTQYKDSEVGEENNLKQINFDTSWHTNDF